MRTIISPLPASFVTINIPETWENGYTIVHPDDVKDTTDTSDVYVINDFGYDYVSRNLSIPEQGFSKELSLLCNDKYKCRRKLKSMQDLPFTICTDNVVNWPYDKNEKLIAKPVSGTGSKGIYKMGSL